MHNTNDDYPTAGVSWKDLHGDLSPQELQKAPNDLDSIESG